jgi:uncharacterized phage protein (TIGR01671 family)
MREIKFRVWNKNRNMFIINGMTPKEIQDDATQSMELPMMTSEDCVWQQYTGLKDKNGVEIYEGDILGYPESLDDKTLSEVRWAKAYSGDQWCEFRIQDINGNNIQDTQPYDYYGGISQNDYRIVVGNVFEGVDK